MIEVSLNGQLREIDEKNSLVQILEQFDFRRERVAVAINSEFVSRDGYHNVFLKAGDLVDIVGAVAGG